LLEQAVRLDPKFTLAYCASAQIHGLLYFTLSKPRAARNGDAAIAKALRLQPDLPEVRLAYAFNSISVTAIRTTSEYGSNWRLPNVA